MELIFRNLFFFQHLFLRIQIPVIFTFFNARDIYPRVCEAHPIKLIVMSLFPDCAV